jgi:AsmA protein
MELARLRGALPGRLGDLLSAGLVSFAGEIATDSAGKYVLKGKASTDELALRGQPASAHTDLTAAINPENLEEFVLEAQGIGVEGPGIRLGGNGAMRGSPLEARIDLRGPLLDLDTLLSVQAAAPGSAELLPPSVRAALADVTVSATLGVDRVVRGGLTATDLRAKGELTRGVLTLSECAAHLYGGESDLSGTRIDFSVPRPDWQLAARLQNVDLGAAMIEVARRRPMDARLAAEVTLHGQGDQWPELRDTMSGHVQTTLSGAVIHIDFGGRIAAALRAMLDGVGMGNVIPELGLGPSTALGDVSLGGTIGGGWMRLDHPVRVAGAFGSASFDGRVGVDTRLDLKGKVRLLPALVARLVAGRPGPRAGLELPVEVTGTLPDPEVKLPTAPAELVRLLVGGAPTPGQVLGEAQRRLRELLGAGR